MIWQKFIPKPLIHRSSTFFNYLFSSSFKVFLDWLINKENMRRSRRQVIRGSTLTLSTRYALKNERMVFRTHDTRCTSTRISTSSRAGHGVAKAEFLQSFPSHSLENRDLHNRFTPNDVWYFTRTPPKPAKLTLFSFLALELLEMSPCSLIPDVS